MEALRDKKLWIIIGVTVVIVAIIVYFGRKKAAETSDTGTTNQNTGASSKPMLPAVDIFPLRFGSRGPEVLAVQKWMNEKLKKQTSNGFVAPLPLLVEDGIWGQKTSDAIKYKIGLDQIDYTYYTKIILGIL